LAGRSADHYLVRGTSEAAEIKALDVLLMDNLAIWGGIQAQCRSGIRIDLYAMCYFDTGLFRADVQTTRPRKQANCLNSHRFISEQAVNRSTACETVSKNQYAPMDPVSLPDLRIYPLEHS
jgi:hypothetical protein